MKEREFPRPKKAPNLKISQQIKPKRTPASIKFPSVNRRLSFQNASQTAVLCLHLYLKFIPVGYIATKGSYTELNNRNLTRTKLCSQMFLIQRRVLYRINNLNNLNNLSFCFDTTFSLLTYPEEMLLKQSVRSLVPSKKANAKFILQPTPDNSRRQLRKFAFP